MADNRRSFRTKNTLNLHGLIFVTLMIICLLIFFLILANIGKAVSVAGLDSGEGNTETVAAAAEDGCTNVKTADADGTFTGQNGSLLTAVYGDSELTDSLCSQLQIMGQSYTRTDSLSGCESFDLLVVDRESLSSEDIAFLETYVSSGGNVWFVSLPQMGDADTDLKDLLGISSIGSVKKYPGLRISADLVYDNILQDTEYKVSAPEIKLKNRTKVYECALPKEYEEIDNEDLPPLIWRYAAGNNTGKVYVNCLSSTETTAIYLMLPKIYSELQPTYMYGVINAYCVLVDGFPYAENAEAENWERLYSRDKMAIAQDMLLDQYLKYAVSYGAKVSYFTRDLETFKTTDDNTLKYYTDSIEGSMGSLLLKTDSGLKLSSEDDKVQIEEWAPGFSFTDTENGDLNLPVNMEFTTDNRIMDEIAFMGSALGLGYYAVSTDVEEFLAYDGEDIWTEYCEDQEVVLGIGSRDVGWLDRVTVPQAYERLYTLLTSDTSVEYGSDEITVKTDAENAWFILRAEQDKNVSSAGAVIDTIGDGCYLVQVNSGETKIQLTDKI